MYSTSMQLARFSAHSKSLNVTSVVLARQVTELAHFQERGLDLSRHEEIKRWGD